MPRDYSTVWVAERPRYGLVHVLEQLVQLDGDISIGSRNRPLESIAIGLEDTVSSRYVDRALVRIDEPDLAKPEREVCAALEFSIIDLRRGTEDLHGEPMFGDGGPPGVRGKARRINQHIGLELRLWQTRHDARSDDTACAFGTNTH